MTEEINYFHFAEWFDTNMIYCNQTHSYIHRLYDAFKKSMPYDYKMAQNVAWNIFMEMQDEFKNGKPKVRG